MTGQLFLGLSDYDANSHTRFTAIAIANDGYWVKQNHFKEELPPVGKAFAVSLPGVKENQPIAFTVKPNPPEHAAEGKDEFIVEQENAFKARRIIDYRRGGFEQARYECVELGFEQPLDPLNDEVIFAIADDRCLVLQIELDQHIQRHVSHTGVVKIFSLNPSVFKSDLIMGHLYEVPEQTVGEQLEEVPWKMDQDLLGDLLKALHKHDQEGPGKNERTKLIGAFTRAKNLAVELPDLAYLDEWLKPFSARLNNYVAAPKRIAETLLQIEPVKQQLEEERSRVESNLREELEPQVRSQLEDQHQALKHDLEAAKSELRVLHNTLEHTNKDKVALEGCFSSLQKELTAQIHRLNTVLGAGDALPKESFEQLLEGLRSALGAHSKLLSPRQAQTPPWSLAQFSPSGRISFAQLPERLNKVAREAGIAGESMQFVDVGARSGALVILPQAQAETLVPAYARAVSRGDFVRVALGPSVLQLDDLWVHPAKEQPTGFAQAWLEAEINPEQVQIVWLDGLHRTPMDLWLPSLIGAIHDENRPSNLLILASLEQNLLDAERFWKDLPQASFAVVPGTQNCGLNQFYKPQQKQATSLDWGSADSTPVDLDDLGDVIDDFERPSDYFALKAETALYQALAKVSSSNKPVSQQLHEMVNLRKQGRDWLAGIIE